MTRSTFVWLIIIALVALTLGAASVIVASNAGASPAGTPAGFVH